MVRIEIKRGISNDNLFKWCADKFGSPEYYITNKKQIITGGKNWEVICNYNTYELTLRILTIYDSKLATFAILQLDDKLG